MSLILFDVDGVIAPHGQAVVQSISQQLRILSQYSALGFISGKPVAYLEGLARGLGIRCVVIIGENGGDIFYPGDLTEILFEPMAPKDLLLMKNCITEQLGSKVWYQHNLVALSLFPRNGATVSDINEVCLDIVKRKQLESVQVVSYVDAVDILPAGLDKGWGIIQARDILGISRSEIVTVGDGINDIPMFRESDLSICIGNHPEVLKAADIAFSATSEALEFLIKKFSSQT